MFLASGKNNDSDILNHILSTESEGIKQWVEDRDVLVIDWVLSSDETIIE